MRFVLMQRAVMATSVVLVLAAAVFAWIQAPATAGEPAGGAGFVLPPRHP